MLEQFTKVADVPQDVIDKYRDQVPPELVQIWTEDGLGTFLDGYLKVINPDDYKALLEETYFRGKVSLPIFVTAFGDVITFEKKGYFDIVLYRENEFHIIAKRMTHFLMFIEDKDFTDDYFDLAFYQTAIEIHGVLEYNQCFGFVPLLGLGGVKNVEHLEKVNSREHIALITQMIGKVGMEN